MTMLKMCASSSIKNKQRKNSYTADSNSSNINLPKQSILLTLYCDLTDEVYHESFTIRSNALKEHQRSVHWFSKFVHLKWSTLNNSQRQHHIRHCRLEFYDQHVMKIDNSYHILWAIEIVYKKSVMRAIVSTLQTATVSILKSIYQERSFQCDIKPGFPVC